MEKAILVLEIAILVAVILNIFKDLFWSKRQKDYYESITPTKILGDLKSLRELLDNTATERDKLKKTVEELGEEIQRLQEEQKSRKVAIIDTKVTTKPQDHLLIFKPLIDLSKKMSILTSSEYYLEMTERMNAISETLKQVSFGGGEEPPPDKGIIKNISGTTKTNDN